MALMTRFKNKFHAESSQWLRAFEKFMEGCDFVTTRPVSESRSSVLSALRSNWSNSDEHNSKTFDVGLHSLNFDEAMSDKNPC